MAARIARAVTLNILEEHDRLARATKRRVRAHKGTMYLYNEVLADDEAEGPPALNNFSEPEHLSRSRTRTAGRPRGAAGAASAERIN